MSLVCNSEIIGFPVKMNNKSEEKGGGGSSEGKDCFRG